jgi:hypothetical protein
MLREQLDILMMLAPVNLVLDAVIREVHLAVEVRQIVFACPLANLPLVAVRTAVAVRPAAVVLLQELLVLALQVVVEDDAPNLESAVIVAEPGLFLAVLGEAEVIDGRVVSTRVGGYSVLVGEGILELAYEADWPGVIVG